VVPHSLSGLACNGPESLTRGEGQCYQGPSGLLHVGVDQPLVELHGGGQFILGSLQPAGHGVRILGAPAHEALGQDFPRGGLEEHQQRVGNGLSHLPGPLDLDLQKHRPTLLALLGLPQPAAMTGRPLLG